MNSFNKVINFYDDKEQIIERIERNQEKIMREQEVNF